MIFSTWLKLILLLAGAVFVSGAIGGAIIWFVIRPLYNMFSDSIGAIFSGNGRR